MNANSTADMTGKLSRQTEHGQLPGWRAFHEGRQAEMGDVWELRDGVLSCRGTPKGYLSTEKDYGSFVLELEWRLPKREGPLNGGVLIRMTGRNQIWPKSPEAQINSGVAGDFWGLAGYELSGPEHSTVVHLEFAKLTHLQTTAYAESPADRETTPGKICLTAEGNEMNFVM